MKALIKILKNQGLNIGSVESLTGGLFASEIVDCPGASDVYLGSIISYANVIKQDLLNIDKQIIDQYGVVSEEVAFLMVKNGSLLLKSDVTVSFTGNAGPDVLENKDVGLVYTCIKIHDKYFNYSDRLSGERNIIRHEIIDLVKTRLIELLKEKGE